MKKLNLMLLIVTAVLSVSVFAQQPPPPPDPVDPPPAPEEPDAPDMQELQRELEAAQRRLEEAAREVAEHSAQLYQEHIPRQVHKIRIERGNGKGAMLGVHIEAAKDSNDNRVDGVAVVGVTPNGPADNAGIKNGDKIVAINGQSLQWQGDQSPAKQLLDIMAAVEPEEAVTVDYVRQGQSNSVIVETGRMENFSWAAGEDFDFDFDFDIDEDRINEIEERVIVLNNGIKSLYGSFRQPWHDLELVQLTPKLGSYFNTDKGVLVVSVGEADELPLEEGDVILNLDGREPNDPAHVIRILRSYQAGETVNFEIMRERRKRSVEYLVEANNENVSLFWEMDDNNFSRLRPEQQGMQIIPLVESDRQERTMILEKQDSI